ncbi:MAG: MerC domain-containing protein [Armatimonadetes bacterium]|nr:MerC domain-containing protein [Armatimonadota bacterium]
MNRWSWDVLGVWVTSLCLVHCAVLPLLVVSLPLFFADDHEQWVHWLLTLVAVPIGALALVPGYRRHRQSLVLLLGVGGVSLMIASTLLAELVHEGFHVAGAMGAVALIAAHLLNVRQCRCNAAPKLAG